MQPPQAPQATECPATAAGLFTLLRQASIRNPALALACSGALTNPIQRDLIQRDAFVAAASRQPDAALPYVPMFLDRPWITDAGFFALASLAASLAPKDPSGAFALLAKTARRYPALALREYPAFIAFPFGQSIFETAATADPGEAVGLACGNSATSRGVLHLLHASKLREVQILAEVADSPRLSQSNKQRAAVFFFQLANGSLSIDQAAQLAVGPDFFAAVANLRLAASSPPDVALYDRVLETYAEILFRATQDLGSAPLPPELNRLRARDVYLLLTYGRTEEDDLLFGTMFDRLLLPKLRATPPSALLDEVHGLNLRSFLATAATHHRLDAFLKLDPHPADLLARSMSGLEQADHPLDEALSAAEILQAMENRATLRTLGPVIVSEYQAAQKSRPLYGLLAAGLTRSDTGADSQVQAIAKRYQRYFHQPRLLDAASLFDRASTCIQQYFFYDDDDANESFASFRDIYRGDPAWKWDDHGWYVEVSSVAAGGRHIRILANVPHSAASPGSEDRRHTLAKWLRDQALTPTVVVHRGHTWYVEQSLRYLTPDARLVFLGSCRGMANAYGLSPPPTRRR